MASIDLGNLNFHSLFPWRQNMEITGPTPNFQHKYFNTNNKVTPNCYTYSHDPRTYYTSDQATPMYYTTDRDTPKYYTSNQLPSKCHTNSQASPPWSTNKLYPFAVKDNGQNSQGMKPFLNSQKFHHSHNHTVPVEVEINQLNDLDRNFQDYDEETWESVGKYGDGNFVDGLSSYFCDHFSLSHDANFNTSDNVAARCCCDNDLLSSYSQASWKPIKSMSRDNSDRLHNNPDEPPAHELPRQATDKPPTVKCRSRSLSVDRRNTKPVAAKGKPRSCSFSKRANKKGADASRNIEAVDSARKRSNVPLSHSNIKGQFLKRRILKKKVVTKVGHDKGNQTVESSLIIVGTECCLNGDQRETLKELFNDMNEREGACLMDTVSSILGDRHGERNAFSDHPDDIFRDEADEKKGSPCEDDVLCEKYIHKYCCGSTLDTSSVLGSACRSAHSEDEIDSIIFRSSSSSSRGSRTSMRSRSRNPSKTVVRRQRSTNKGVELRKEETLKQKLEKQHLLRCKGKSSSPKEREMKNNGKPQNGQTYDTRINVDGSPKKAKFCRDISKRKTEKGSREKGSSYCEACNSLKDRPKEGGSYCKRKHLGKHLKKGNSYCEMVKDVEKEAVKSTVCCRKCGEVDKHPQKISSYCEACKNMREGSKKGNSCCEVSNNVKKRPKQAISYSETCKNMEECPKKGNSCSETCKNMEERPKKGNSYSETCKNMEERPKKGNSYSETCKNMEERPKKGNSCSETCKDIKERPKKGNSYSETYKNIEERLRKGNSYCETNQNVEERCIPVTQKIQANLATSRNKTRYVYDSKDAHKSLENVESSVENRSRKEPLPENIDAYNLTSHFEGKGQIDVDPSQGAEVSGLDLPKFVETRVIRTPTPSPPADISSMPVKCWWKPPRCSNNLIKWGILPESSNSAFTQNPPKTPSSSEHLISLQTQDSLKKHHSIKTSFPPAFDIHQDNLLTSCVTDLANDLVHKGKQNPTSDVDDGLRQDVVRHDSDVSLSQRIAELNFSKDSYNSGIESISILANRVPLWKEERIPHDTPNVQTEVSGGDRHHASSTCKSDVKRKQEMMLYINRSTQTLIQKANDRIKNVEDILESATNDQALTLSVRQGSGGARHEDSTTSHSSPTLLELQIQASRNSRHCVREIMPSHMKPLTSSRPDKVLTKNISNISSPRPKLPTTLQDNHPHHDDTKLTPTATAFDEYNRCFFKNQKDTTLISSSASLNTSTVLTLDTSGSVSCTELKKLNETFTHQEDECLHCKPKAQRLEAAINSSSEKNDRRSQSHQEQTNGDCTQPTTLLMKTYSVSAAMPVKTNICSDVPNSDLEPERADPHFWWQSQSPSTFPLRKTKRRRKNSKDEARRMCRLQEGMNEPLDMYHGGPRQGTGFKESRSLSLGSQVRRMPKSKSGFSQQSDIKDHYEKLAARFHRLSNVGLAPKSLRNNRKTRMLSKTSSKDLKKLQPFRF